jgi:hypothetical protein
MIGKIILTMALLASGVALAQTPQPTANGTQPESIDRLPRECWDTHTNRPRPITAADAKSISVGPGTTGAAGIPPGPRADRPAGMPQCD